MIALIGAGFLGSIFAEEVGKRIWAQEAGQVEFLVVDGDMFEARNCANQNVRPYLFDDNLGVDPVSKAREASLVLQDYRQKADFNHIRITPENINEVLDPAKVTVIVDAVDNLETRQLLWSFGIKHGIPVMHLGMSQAGTGAVEWTVDIGQDSFMLSPLNTMGQEKPPEVPKRLRPCELIAHRATGFLIAHRGAVALGHWFAIDPEQMFPDLNGRSFASSWQISDLGVRHAQNFVQA